MVRTEEGVMHKRLGEILVQAGVIDDEQLKLALAEAALWGHRVGEVLVSRGDCEEAQILEALGVDYYLIPRGNSATSSRYPRARLRNSRACASRWASARARTCIVPTRSSWRESTPSRKRPRSSRSRVTPAWSTGARP